jgi:hypothetical protein
MSSRNSQGNTPIHLASAANRIGALELLVSANPDDVNVRNALGQTPGKRGIENKHSTGVESPPPPLYEHWGVLRTSTRPA